jgi:hypothetical protein
MTCPASENSTTVVGALNQLVKSANCLGSEDLHIAGLTESVLELSGAISGLCGCLNITVNCNGGGGGGGSIVDPPISPTPDPEGDPPDGFSTWEEFYNYKCAAAEYIVETSIGFFNFLGTLNSAFSGGQAAAAVGALLVSYFETMMLATLSATEITVASPTIVLAGGAIATAPLWLQAAIVAAIAGTVVVVGLGSFALFSTMAADFISKKDDVICDLYNSTPETAKGILTTAWGDSIAAFVISAPYNTYEAQIRAMMSSIIGLMVTNAFTNQLFEKSTTILKYTPSGDCSECSDDEFLYFLQVVRGGIINDTVQAGVRTTDIMSGYIGNYDVNQIDIHIAGFTSCAEGETAFSPTSLAVIDGTPDLYLLIKCDKDGNEDNATTLPLPSLTTFFVGDCIQRIVISATGANQFTVRMTSQNQITC